MSQIEDLQREIAETKAAVAGVARSASDCVVRVSEILDRFKNMPTSDMLTQTIKDLNDQQAVLAQATTMLDALGKPAES